MSNSFLFNQLDCISKHRLNFKKRKEKREKRESATYRPACSAAGKNNATCNSLTNKYNTITCKWRPIGCKNARGYSTRTWTRIHN